MSGYLMPISNLAEDPAPIYGAAIRNAATLGALRDVLHAWNDIAHDAVICAANPTKTDVDWDWAKKHVKDEKHGERITLDWGPVFMPEVMLLCTLTADQFKAPWGLCFNRLIEVGRLKIVGLHIEIQR